MAEKPYKIARSLVDDAYIVAEIAPEKVTFACGEHKDVTCEHIATVKQAVKTGNLPDNYKWYSGAILLADPGTRFWAAVGLALYRIAHRAETGKWPEKLVVPVPTVGHTPKADRAEPQTAPPMPVVPEKPKPSVKELSDTERVAIADRFALIELE